MAPLLAGEDMLASASTVLSSSCSFLRVSATDEVTLVGSLVRPRIWRRGEGSGEQLKRFKPSFASVLFFNPRFLLALELARPKLPSRKDCFGRCPQEPIFNGGMKDAAG